MKALSSLLLVLAICVATVIPSSAAADKELTNVFGNVTYQLGTAAAQPVAPKVSVALANNAYAVTGANSQASITMPDSSVVQIGQSTKVQLGAFDQAPGIATASFVVLNGKVRFKVNHPNGAKANYTFQTSTGQIAVRGTEGDISTDATSLQVNVYALGDPNLPVEVTLNNGKKYTLGAGQALVVGITGAVVAAAAVSSVTTSMTSTFAEFGPASNSAAAAGAGGAAGGAAGAAGAAVAPAAIAGAAAAAAAAAVVAGTHASTPHSVTTPKPTPKPTPTPTPTPTPMPGNVTGVPATISLGTGTETSSFTASQKHGSGSFSAASDNSGAATVSPATSSGAFTVTAAGSGTANITITGDDGKTAVAVVNSAANTITSGGTSTLNITPNNPTGSFTASETGYTGSFTPSSNPSGIVTIASGSSARSHDTKTTFNVTGIVSGSTKITVTDSFGNTMPTINATVAIGPIKLDMSSLTFDKAFGEQQTFNASEKGFTGNFSATVSPSGVVNVTASSSGLFKVTSVGNGTATITVKDGQGNASSPLPVTVSSPVPQPSTTCVPIIIHARHFGGVGPETATPCPSAAGPSTPRTGLKNRPGVLPPSKPRHQLHSPGNPLHPMQPLTGPQGILTPPPLPIPPGGGPP